MRCIKWIVLFSVDVFLLTGMMRSPLFAQEEKEFFTLSESIDMALDKNWSLKAKKEGVSQATAVKNQTRAEFLPSLNTRYGYTYNRDIDMNYAYIEFSGFHDTYQWVTSASVPVFTGFATISSYELTKLGIDLAEVEVALEKLDLALRVKEAYFNILIADRAVEVAEKDVASRKSNADVARNFYEVGMIPVNDLLQAEVEWADAQQYLVKVQNGARVARSAFNVILAREVNAPVDVEDILDYKPEIGKFEDYLKQALKERPEIKSLEIAILQADQQIRLAKSGYFPTVSLSAQYTKMGDDYDVGGSVLRFPYEYEGNVSTQESEYHKSHDFRAGIDLSWNLSELGWSRTRSSVREKESLKRELLENKRALEDSINLELKTALMDLETAEKNIPTTQKAVEQGEENLRVSEERYKAQVTTITEVLDAQTRLSRARLNYFQAFYEHNLSKARLLRAMGEY
ncbi:MAG: TolC family protein [Deltaproteobacteria bacterium]|nr:TolC family protein [Deltaproteobacteria bacterium]